MVLQYVRFYNEIVIVCIYAARGKKKEKNSSNKKHN